MIIKLFEEYNRSNYWVELTDDEWDELSDIGRKQPDFTSNEIEWIEETLKEKNLKIVLEKNTTIQIVFPYDLRNSKNWFYCYKEDDYYFDVQCDLGLYRCDEFDGLKKFIEYYLESYTTHSL
jgi:hypothetical protein